MDCESIPAANIPTDINVPDVPRTQLSRAATISPVSSPSYRSDDTSFDPFVRAKRLRNRAEIATRGKMTHTMLVLVPMGYLGSKGFRSRLKKHSGFDSKTLSETIQASAIDYLWRIDEST